MSMVVYRGSTLARVRTTIGGFSALCVYDLIILVMTIYKYYNKWHNAKNIITK